MKLRLRAIFDRLQNVLLISFALIAIVTFVVMIWTTSAIVNSYTERAENDRVARDMNLAVAFCERSLIQINGTAKRLANEPTLAHEISATRTGNDEASDNLERRNIYPLGSHFILVVDEEGNLVAAQGIVDQRLQRLPTTGNWIEFPLLALPIARIITRPLEEMAEASRQVAQGNTQVRIPNQGVGEVAVLGQAFNTMVAELEATQAQLIRKEKLASMGQSPTS